MIVIGKWSLYLNPWAFNFFFSLLSSSEDGEMKWFSGHLMASQGQAATSVLSFRLPFVLFHWEAAPSWDAAVGTLYIRVLFWLNFKSITTPSCHEGVLSRSLNLPPPFQPQQGRNLYELSFGYVETGKGISNKKRSVCMRSECIQPYLHTFLQSVFHSEYKSGIS